MKKTPNARQMGKRGGRARMKLLTAAQRTALARKAAMARWSKGK